MIECIRKISGFSDKDRRLWKSKAFYVSFYVAVGALFPYLPVYFKQLNLSPHQNGILIGIRPLIQFFATPVWGACADRFGKSKAIFLLSVLGWLVSNFLLCMVPVNKDPDICTNYADEIPLSQGNRSRFLGQSSVVESPHSGFVGDVYLRDIHAKQKWDFFVRISPYIDTAVPSVPVTFQDFQTICRNTLLDLNDSRSSNSLDRTTIGIKDGQEVPLRSRKPTSFESEISDGDRYISCDSEQFIFLLSVTVLGTIIAAPAQMLADTATLQSLNRESHKYGRVRLWGSLGWGVGGFSAGAAVSRNHKTNHCGVRVIDYLPCFYVYAVAMAVAFLCATQFQFEQVTVAESQDEQAPVEVSSNQQGITDGLRVFRSVQFCFVIFIAFFCGSSTGFIETFLFWYLHDLGGTQLLFSVVNGLNCAAEVFVFFITDKLIYFLGYMNVIYLALFCYSIRFTYFYFVVSPWAVLPAELLQGITTAAFWSSCVSYVGLHPGASHTLQGILNGVYMGLGFSTGGFMGGVLVHLGGVRNSFILYAVASLLIMLLFVALNKVKIK